MTNNGYSNSLILAIETSGDVCGTAVLRNGELITEHVFRHGMHLSERLIGHIDDVLSEADAKLDNLDMIAVGIGPGSFTGTRVGVMTAKTLASLRSVTLFGVDALEALAFEHMGLVDTTVFPVAPCRKEVVYSAAYRVEGAIPKIIHSPDAVAFAELSDQLRMSETSRILFCGPSSSKSRDELFEIGKTSGKMIQFGNSAPPRASVIGKLAWFYAYYENTPDSPFDLVPLYISPPPITLPKVKV